MTAEMTPESWKKVSRILSEAEALNPDDREKFLETLNQEDPDVCSEVERLLGSAETETDLQGGDSQIAWQKLADLHAGGDSPTRERGRLPQLEGYAIIVELGRGGMGVVYKARQQKLNRLVALKMIRAASTAGQMELTRFRKEAEAVAGLQHPNIVEIYEIGEHDGLPYFSLEFCAGGSLAERIRQRPLPPREAAELVKKLAQAISAAHQANIIHRDLKPANVLLTKDGIPKISDFGLAKKLDEQVGQTQSGAIMGTPAYMAPEQAAGKTKEIGPPADIYSLGAILYECLTGQPVFNSDSTIETIQQVLSKEPVSPRQLQPKVPRDLETICLKCLQKEPARRYRSVAELAEDLRRFLANEQIIARRRTLLEKMNRWVWQHWRVPAAGFCLLVLAFVVWFFAKATHVDPYVAHRKEEVRQLVERIMAKPPEVIREPHPGRQWVDKLPPTNRNEFEVLERYMLWDLRAWKPIPKDVGQKLISPVTCIGRSRLRKLTDTLFFRSDSRTLGTDIFERSPTHGKKMRVLACDAPVKVGGLIMKSRQSVFDVSEIPVDGEFFLETHSTFWNSFREEKPLWVGAMVGSKMSKVSFLLIMPTNRPMRSYQLRVAQIDGDDLEEYKGPQFVFDDPDGRYLFWEITNPKIGKVYRVDWQW